MECIIRRERAHHGIAVDSKDDLEHLLRDASIGVAVFRDLMK
jgi:hypothetical protein